MNSRIKYLILILICFAIISNAQNNRYRIERITKHEGLSQNSGISIIQDSDGFIWIGTANGLNKFDGSNFTIYKNDKNNPHSLSHNYINSLFEDRNGKLWIGTNKGGLNEFDKYTEDFTSYQHNPLDSNSIGHGSIYSITQDNFGNIWVAVNPSGLYFFEQSNQIFHQFHLTEQINKKESSTRVFSIAIDESNILWVGTSIGLITIEFIFPENSIGNKLLLNDFNFLSSNCKIIKWDRTIDQNQELKSSNVSNIAIQKTKIGKNIWLGMWPGFSKITITKDDTTIINFSNSRALWSVFKDSENTLWLGEYNNGISNLDLNKSGDLKNLTKLFSTDANYRFSDWTIRSIAEDITGNIWAGSEQFGVLKISKNKINTKSYKHIEGNPSTISGNIIRRIYKDSKNNIWVGTKFNGLNKLRLNSDGSITNIEHFKYSKNVNSIPNNYVSDIYEDSKGRIWVSSWNMNGGLSLLNPATKNFTRFQNKIDNSNSLADNQVTAISEDKDGNLIIGTSEKGFDIFNYNKNKFTHFVHDPQNENSLSSNTITSILTDSHGVIWLGTYGGGLNKFNLNDSLFTHYTNSGFKNNISENRINGIYEDDENNIWILTANGLNKINVANNKIEIFLKSNTIDNAIFSIVQDKELNYWVTTSSGLTKINKQTREIRTYGVNDGLPNTNFASHSLALLGSGNLLVGTSDGLFEFSPNDISEKKERTGNVVFTSFKVFNKDYKLDTAITYKKNIELSYDENFFSVEFALLDFDNPAKNIFKYKLKGLIDEWSEPQTENYINFANVSDGEYELKILGANNDGVWSNSAAVLNITIIPPFWKTLWFRTLLFILLILVIYFSLRQIISRKYKLQLQKMEIEQKVQEERERISSDLHDNIGANLSGIVTGLDMTKKHFDQLDQKRVRQNISSLHSHTKETIDLLRQAIWSLQDNVKTCDELLTKVQDFIRHQIISNSQPKPQIICNIDKDKIFAPFDSLNLFRIIQEAVNNAIKYSKSKSIKIMFSETSNGETRIEIVDYGIGFNYEELLISGRGFGLQNMKKRADKIGAKLQVESKPDEGTRVIIEL